jgi:hypothetical protein
MIFVLGIFGKDGIFFKLIERRLYVHYEMTGLFLEDIVLAIANLS